MTTTVENLLERFTVTVTEYPQDPWGDLEGPVFHVQAKWREGAEYESLLESTAPTLSFGRGATRDAAIADFRESVARKAADIEERRVQHEIYANPTSVEEVTL